MKGTTEDSLPSWAEAELALEQFGVARQRVRAFLDKAAAGWLPQDVVPEFSRMLAVAADPAAALSSLERLLDLGSAAESGQIEKAWWRDLVVLLGGSPSLGNWLVAQERQWATLFSAARNASGARSTQHVEQLEYCLAEPWTTFADTLRHYRHREYLRIGLQDLLGNYSVEDTWRELSELAAGLVEVAYRWARCQLEQDYGRLLTAPGSPAGFVVLGMGKLGGGELNFSSDIDLVYLYETDEARCTGGRAGVLTPRAYFTRLAEWLTRALQEVTAKGFAFRVDLRLRPDGVNGPIVNSISNALLYYESYGQTWERTALLKARPVAGDAELGERFLLEVRPFVFRRYLDFATIADMQRMKAQIDAQLKKKGDEYNLKLGRGGIREIEFLVQTMQLVHGGRDERVRCRSTVEALERLAACRYLPVADAEALREAYRFLRDVEHKLQIEGQRQTHVIPADPLRQDVLARRLGFKGKPPRGALWRELARQTQSVRQAFDKLFFQPETERRAQAAEAEERILSVLDHREAAVEVLASLGFRHPEQSYEHLLFLRDGPPSSPSSPRRRQVLFEILPSLLAAMRRSPYPDLAIQNMASFLAAVGARTSFLMLLRENPGTMRMLVRVFATSQYLANQFIRHPELLDSLVRADLVRVRCSHGELSADLESLLAAAGDFEAKLDALRRFRNQEFLRIGINCVEEVLQDEEVGAELTTLADVCVQAALRVATEETLARFGETKLPGSVVILGLGKLGAGELNFNSDLDLIFVYDAPERASTNPSPHEIFTWLAQRLITVLQAPTKEGIVYRIDTRLRPSGRSGPLVSSLGAFRHYHEESARIWERQALIKARAVAGDDRLAREVGKVIEQFVYRASLRAEEVREIRRLRGRMERELARERADHVNIKTGRGGLVDIEFLVQMLQLHCGVQQQGVRCRATLEALHALERHGILPASDAEVLATGYRFLRRLEQTLRLLHDRPVEDLERHDFDVVVVARRLGFGQSPEPAQALWQEYVRRREMIRELYESWFERAEQGEVSCGGG